MRIYITGATGYIGSHLLPRLKEYNHEIVCLLRNPEKHTDNEILHGCLLIKGDITDRESFHGTIDGSDIVIHLAVSTPLTNINGDNTIIATANGKINKDMLAEM